MNLNFKLKLEFAFFLLAFLQLTNLSFSQVYTIPTVVHIITSNAQPVILTDAQVQAGIANLNEQFSGAYAEDIINTILPEHQSYINDTQIRFELASINPSGNATIGITRTYNNTWSTSAQAYQVNLMSALTWDRSKYFNIYVVERLNSDNQSGIAYRPGEVASTQDAVKDGALVTFRIWPVDFPFIAPQWPGFEGTMAHEIGHYFNLSHTWGQTNDPTTCDNPICNDFVSDTPKHFGSLNGFGALQRATQCDGLVAMTDNFMTYSRHQCIFTPGQRDRMHEALNSPLSSRNNLWTAANLEATGTGSGSPPPPPPSIYCSARGADGTDTDYITNVSVGNIDHNSGKSDYSDFTSISMDVVLGGSYPITVDIDTDWGQDQAYAWVDWNDDQVFDNSTELISFSAFSNTIATGTLVVPNNTPLGAVRLRVRVIYADPNTPQACGDIYGEVEDYTLNVVSSSSYCSARGADGTDTDYITNVSVGNIDHNSGKSDYSDFTSISTDVVLGGSYPITVDIDTDWGQDQAYAWVDWNDDLVFDNSTELISFSAFSNTIATGTLVVPNNTPLGAVRLRVRVIYADPNTPQACGDIYGEVEDYTLNVVSSSSYCSARGADGTDTDYITNVSVGNIDHNSGKSDYSDFTSISTDVVLGGSYPITVDIDTDWGQDQAYAWVDWNDDQVFDNSTELISFSAFSNTIATGTLVVPNNTPLGAVRLRVRVIYADPNTPQACGDIYGEVEDYTLNVVSSSSYCSARGADGTDTDYITNISVGNIDHNSGKSDYSDFTSISTDVVLGGSYPITVDIDTDWGQDQAYAWVDWNDDQVFDNSTELISFSAFSNTIATGTLVVPNNTPLGAVRLRVRVIYANPNTPQACGDIYGEVEDYTLIVQTCNTSYYADADGDGYGDPNTSLVACSPPSGFVLDNTDCDDNNGNIFPTASCNDGDANTINDAYNANCQCIGIPIECNANSLTLELQLDDYPEETSWQINDANGVSIVSGGNYNGQDNALISINICLEDGCYDLIINDSYGDGICCAYGNGFYRLIDINGQELASGASFTDTDMTNFCLNTGNNCNSQLIDSEDFESGWGIWNDGGVDARKNANDAAYANSGTYCVRLRDNTEESVITTNILDLSGYSEISIDFSYQVESFENTEDFWLQISLDGGQSFTTIEDWVRTIDFQNSERKDVSVTIPGPFTNTTQFRLRCDASGNGDWVYIDDIVLSGCQLSNSNTLVLLKNGQDIEKVAISTLEFNEKLSALSFFDLKVYPNPAVSELTLQFQSPQERETLIELFSLTGQQLFSLNRDARKGNNRISIDVSQIPSGIYLLSVLNGERQLKKIVITR